MNLHDLEARLQRPPRGLCEFAHDGADLLFAEHQRRLVSFVERDRTRSHGCPAALLVRNWADALPRRRRRGLAPGVRQLDPRDATLRVQEAHDPRMGLDVAVAPNAQILRADATVAR